VYIIVDEIVLRLILKQYFRSDTYEEENGMEGKIHFRPEDDDKHGTVLEII
jgi:hypothetical protein